MSTFNSANLNLNMKLLRSMGDDVAQVFQQFHGERLRAERRPRLHSNPTPEEARQAREAIAAETHTARDVAYTALEELRGKVKSHAGDAEEQIGRALKRPAPKDTNEAILRELREQRAWGRTQKLLDAARDYEGFEKTLREIIAAAASSGDDDVVDAVQAEIGPYVISRGFTDYQALVNLAVYNGLRQGRPEIGPALDTKQELERGVANLESLIEYARVGIATGETKVVAPDWGHLSARTIAFDGQPASAPAIYVGGR